MRRLVKHALAAAGISALTTGAVVGSVVSGPSHSPTATADPPAVVSPAPVPTGSSSPLPAAEEEQRLIRESRTARQAAVAASADAESRERALAQQQAQAKRKAAAEKKRVAAAAESKREAAAERKREAAAKRLRLAAAEKRAVEAEAKRRGYDRGASPKSIARQMMKSTYGWGARQFTCYNNIIMRESVWKVDADNPTSSAYGIPQALPGRKMASAGSDWRTNPATQIKWGLGYVKERYGTPCAAWSFKRTHDWY